jgi:hypothetical protein
MVANRKSKEPTSMRDNQPPPPAKRIQAREAALKKQVASARGRGRKAATDANDENVDLTGLGGSRRSSRLNVTAQGVAGTAMETNSNTSAEPLLDKPNAPPVKRKPAGKAPNVNYRGPKSQHLFSSPVGDADGGAATDDEDGEEELAPRSKKSKAPLAGAPSGLEEIQDLKRQLQEERGHSPYCF